MSSAPTRPCTLFGTNARATELDDHFRAESTSFGLSVSPPRTKTVTTRSRRTRTSAPTTPWTMSCRTVARHGGSAARAVRPASGSNTTTGRWAPASTCSSRATRRPFVGLLSRPSTTQAVPAPRVATLWSGPPPRCTLPRTTAPPAELLKIFNTRRRRAPGTRLFPPPDAGCCCRCRCTAATAPAVRVHRQQVRVPRARSSIALALPNTVLNMIVAEAIDMLCDKLQARGLNRSSSNDAIVEIVREQRRPTRVSGACGAPDDVAQGGEEAAHDEAPRRTRCRGCRLSRRSSRTRRCPSASSSCASRCCSGRTKLNIEATVRHLGPAPPATDLISETGLVDDAIRSARGRHPPRTSTPKCATTSSRRWRHPRDRRQARAHLWPLPQEHAVHQDAARAPTECSPAKSGTLGVPRAASRASRSALGRSLGAQATRGQSQSLTLCGTSACGPP